MERLIVKQENERDNKPMVGLRLQDAILRADTTNPIVLNLREEIKEYRLYSQEENERIIVLEIISKSILGKNLSNALEEAGKLLIPYHNNGEKRKSLIISSASSASASQETECAILKTRGHVIDISGAIEGRDTRSAQNGDISLISTNAGLMMAKSREDVNIINLADEVVLDQTGSSDLKGSDIYYKADGLLLLILTNPNSPVLTRLIVELNDSPLVYPYNLDEETQIALLWLSKMAGIDYLNVNANSHEVGIELKRKGYRYPTIEDALTITEYDDP